MSEIDRVKTGSTSVARVNAAAMDIIKIIGVEIKTIGESIFIKYLYIYIIVRVCALLVECEIRTREAL